MLHAWFWWWNQIEDSWKQLQLGDIQQEINIFTVSQLIWVTCVCRGIPWAGGQRESYVCVDVDRSHDVAEWLEAIIWSGSTVWNV